MMQDILASQAPSDGELVVFHEQLGDTDLPISAGIAQQLFSLLDQIRAK